MRDFALFKERDSEFKIKTRARIGTESIHGLRNAENNHRDYGIGRNLVRDYGIEEPDWGASKPQTTKQKFSGTGQK